MRKRKNPKRSGSIIILVFILGVVLSILGWQVQVDKNLGKYNQFNNFNTFRNITNLRDLSNRNHSDNFKTPKNFTEAKQLARKIYADYRKTFYCSCEFDEQGKIDLKSCGYQIQQDIQRAKRVEWEHIVPISQIAAHLPCWQKKICTKENGERYKGRACCREIDAVFAKMEADLHNLVPEIGELNACRSNFRFGMLAHIKPGQFGECYFKVDRETRRVEPRQEIRGMIARIYLYVADRYAVHLSDSQLQLFKAWDRAFPPDAWELERDNRIAKIQGHNPYIIGYH